MVATPRSRSSLRRDGYVVQALAEPATLDRLAKGDIYVIANAIAESDQKGWKLPAEPAFTKPEIEAIRDWVEGGGSLFLIADHMPFPGSVADLAAEFDILFGNGFPLRLPKTTRSSSSPGSRAWRTIPSPRAATADERIDSVRTFTGQAFRSSVSSNLY